MLHQLFSTTKEKVVIVSNYTQVRGIIRLQSTGRGEREGMGGEGLSFPSSLHCPLLPSTSLHCPLLPSTALSFPSISCGHTHFSLVIPVLIQMLDILEGFCHRRGYGFLRLDGSTPTSKRQGIVERFNNKHGTEGRSEGGRGWEEREGVEGGR